jgi:hypothetical protein
VKRAVGTLDLVSDHHSGEFAERIRQTVRFENALNALETTPPLGDFHVAAEGASARTLLDFAKGLPTDSFDSAAFRNAAKEHQAYLQNVFTTAATSARLVPMNSDQGSCTCQPEITIAARVRHSSGRRANRRPILEPFSMRPIFPTDAGRCGSVAGVSVPALEKCRRTVTADQPKFKVLHIILKLWFGLLLTFLTDQWALPPPFWTRRSSDNRTSIEPPLARQQAR